MFTFSGSDFNNFPRIFVYAWIRGGDWLYVGQTTMGMSRLYTHHVVNVMDKVRDEDQFLIWPCNSERESLDIEGDFIATKSPKYNCNRPVVYKYEPPKQLSIKFPWQQEPEPVVVQKEHPLLDWWNGLTEEDKKVIHKPIRRWFLP